MGLRKISITYKMDSQAESEVKSNNITQGDVGSSDKPISKRKRGRKPLKNRHKDGAIKVPDKEMDPDDLNRLNKRRDRNREAAKRCRERREKQVTDLEDRKRTLEGERRILKEKNQRLKTEIEQVKLQLANSSRSASTFSISPSDVDIFDSFFNNSTQRPTTSNHGISQHQKQSEETLKIRKRSEVYVDEAFKEVFKENPPSGLLYHIFIS